MSRRDWLEWKNKRLVTCNGFPQAAIAHVKDDEHSPDKNGGCSHQAAASACHTTKEKRKSREREVAL